jgi:hypothetical protein
MIEKNFKIRVACFRKEIRETKVTTPKNSLSLTSHEEIFCGRKKKTRQKEGAKKKVICFGEKITTAKARAL